MATIHCFPRLSARKKKDKGSDVSPKGDYNKALKTLHIRLDNKQVKLVESKSMSRVPESRAQKDAICNVKVGSPESPALYDVKVRNRESPVGYGATEVAYEGEDEHEEDASIRKKFCDLDLQSHVANLSGEFSFGTKMLDSSDSVDAKLKGEIMEAEKDGQKGILDTIQSGHLSDPGISKVEFWDAPKLKRSCSNLETEVEQTKIAEPLPPSKSESYDDLQDFSVKRRKEFIPGSPLSVMTRGSADKVMLKKHSSSHVLPSKSRRLWWKLLLWSHRNFQKPWTTKRQPLLASANNNQQGGYCSDTLELNQATYTSNLESASPLSLSGERSPEFWGLNKVQNDNTDDNQSWKGFHNGASGLLPQNQWLALPVGSASFSRVEEWVNGLDTEMLPPPANEDANTEEDIDLPASPNNAKPLARHADPHPDNNMTEEITQANNVIQSLNSSTTVAHISGIGLKAIPTISCFSSLRSVNLSNNLIVNITHGSLPKGLHTLNLSKNKINTIEGLRELTRLRVLDLSYNRISRIGQGLSNCTLIKELYLSGNKIGDVEGLHRLLKLTVLDLSFNKITSTKALGQLVANYNSLQALNLLGNSIQNNISEEQLRKSICSLLPKVVYLNKQPVKPQRTREVLTDSVAKAALGSRRKITKKVTLNRSKSSLSAAQKNKEKSRTQRRR